jgi:uncharacterized protein (DUF433 family)
MWEAVMENHEDLIVIDPAICHGKPTVRGTRVPVSIVLGHMAGGDSFEEICRNYDITPEDIRACVAFANREIRGISYHPLSA